MFPLLWRSSILLISPTPSISVKLTPNSTLVCVIDDLVTDSVGAVFAFVFISSVPKSVCIPLLSLRS
ncbi:MAG: hypothetical protein IJV72_06060 [Clostridia bacterium]|nr:hypothetical protein [Clostridia bacterium]